MKKSYNMNHEDIFLSHFPSGTFIVKVKLGYKIYTLEIVKDACDTVLCLYGSKKYEGSAVLGVFVRNDRMITRDFLENLPEVEKAQRLIYSYINTYVKV